MTSFQPNHKKTIVRLYKSLVRPKLEYCLQSWNPSLIKDIELLEQVQHRATKLIPEIAHLSYHERLKYLNLTTLELRRHQEDLIETFKILKILHEVSHKGKSSMT